MSDWDEESAFRRDFRNSRDTPEVPKHRKRHDRSVCKRSPDRMHTFEREPFPPWMPRGDSFRSWWTPALRCVFCGRIEY